MTDLSMINKVIVDQDLLERLVAAAAEANIDSPQQWVQQNRYRLAVAKVMDGATDTVASVYEYADGQRNIALEAVPVPVGENPAAVTDDYLRHAVAQVQIDLTPPYEPPVEETAPEEEPTDPGGA